MGFAGLWILIAKRTLFLFKQVDTWRGECGGEGQQSIHPQSRFDDEQVPLRVFRWELQHLHIRCIGTPACKL